VAPGGRETSPGDLEPVRLAALGKRQAIAQGQGSFADGFAWTIVMAWSRICWISYEWAGS